MEDHHDAPRKLSTRHMIRPESAEGGRCSRLRLSFVPDTLLMTFGWYFGADGSPVAP
eukprot:gene6455-1681_t